jgi:hypothetical protein
MERAAQWDGIIPTVAGGGEGSALTPDALARIVAAVKEIREAKNLPWEGYDVVAEGVSEPGEAGDAAVASWVDAGANFWVESDWSMGDDAVAKHRRRIEAGPPSPATS